MVDVVSVSVKELIREEAELYAKELGVPASKVWSSVIVSPLQTKKRELKKPRHPKCLPSTKKKRNIKKPKRKRKA